MLYNPLMCRPLRLPLELTLACRRNGIRVNSTVLLVSVAKQKMAWLERINDGSHAPMASGASADGGVSSDMYRLRRLFVVSTSRFGTGQVADSNRTPLGLHRVAARVGAGHPIGTVFESRRPVGLTWQGCPNAPIAHRILWLEGLEPGLNRGGNVDSRDRYIYIHGLGNELTLGRPASRGCIHMAAADLLPFFDQVAVGTLVWISDQPFIRPNR